MTNFDSENSEEDLDQIMLQFDALSNKNRITILESMRKNEQKNSIESYGGEYYCMSANEIREELRKIHIEIAPQMVGQHLKKLMKAGFIDRIKIRIKNDKSISKHVYGYYRKEDAFENLFFKVNFFKDEVTTFVDWYEKSKESKKDSDCVITVFNGVDRGEQLTINKDQVAFIGKRSPERPVDYGSSALILSNKYSTVSSINTPHLIVYNKNGTWYMMDMKSFNGTYCSQYELERNKPFELPNNSLISLSKGEGSALLYCSYN